jgi:tRNA(Ile)-lysidine synthase
MRPSHGPSLRTLVRRLLEAELCSARHQRIACAVSGGPDSMAMLDVLASLRAEQGLELIAIGVDHGLRSESVAELALAAGHASLLGVPFHLERVSLEPGGNLQARARSARYEALERRADLERCPLVATAHTADDRAETVLARILRGAGARGLAVLSPLDGRRVRPLIRARRSDVLAHLAHHGVPSVEDPSNQDPRFVRTRLRHEVLPLLATLDPRVVDHLNDLADDLVSIDWPVPSGPPLGRRQRRQLESIRAAHGRGTVRIGGALEVTPSDDPPARGARVQPTAAEIRAARGRPPRGV